MLGGSLFHASFVLSSLQPAGIAAIKYWSRLACLYCQEYVAVGPTDLVGIGEVAHDAVSKLRYALFQALLCVKAEGRVVTGPDLLDEAFQRAYAVESEKFYGIERQAGDVPNGCLDAVERVQSPLHQIEIWKV